MEELTLDVPNGTHSHVVLGNGMTGMDGAHRHAFRDPAGNVFSTDIGGQHSHCYEHAHTEPDTNTEKSGCHEHTITMPSGIQLITRTSGYEAEHCHKLVDGAIIDTGEHRHALTRLDGVVLTSLMPGDDLRTLAEQLEFVAERADMETFKLLEPTTATIFMGLDKGVACTVIEVEGLVDQIVIKNGRGESVAVPSFAPRGDRTQKTVYATHTRGKNATDLVKVGTATVEPGLQTGRVTELFLSGSSLRGVVKVRAETVEVAVVATPLVVTKGAPLPPVGVTGLPASLANATPSQGRYWEEAGDLAASAKRDVLVRSAYFAEKSLVSSYGTLYKVARTERVTLVKASDVVFEELTYASTLTKLIPAGRRVVIKGVGWEMSSLVTDDVVDGTLIIEAGTNVASLDGLEKCSQRYLVVAKSTESMVARLRELGELFTVTTSDAKELVFTASFEVGADYPEVEPFSEAPMGAPASAGTSAPDVPSGLADTLYQEVEVSAAELAQPPVSDLGATLGMGQEKQEAAAPHQTISDLGTAATATDSPTPVVTPPTSDDADRAANVEKCRVLHKAADSDQRMAIGVVLEPEVVDLQDDIYSEATIRKAAHIFMERFQNRGLQHEQMVNEQIKLLESYVTLTNMNVGGQFVRKGTWLMVVRYDDAKLWEAVKSGEYTGFSIGGWSRRIPENGA